MQNTRLTNISVPQLTVSARTDWALNEMQIADLESAGQQPLSSKTLEQKDDKKDNALTGVLKFLKIGPEQITDITKAVEFVGGFVNAISFVFTAFSTIRSALTFWVFWRDARRHQTA